MGVKRIVCSVTNDLNFDQRMIRICSSLANAGYDVLLVGRKRASSKPLIPQPFQQKRIPCFFDKGKLFYLEYNLRLFITLLLIKTDVYCAIDLDTILPNLLASMLRKKPRVYDAHELFCEMEEIVSRPGIQRIWKRIEMFAVPKFSHGYTIGACYANEFLRKYNVRYAIVRNATVLQPFQEVHKSETYILYQGAVNEGRCFENLIPAMKQVPTKLIVCGEGNFYKQAIELSLQHHTTHIEFKGYIPPSELRRFTQHASIGLTLFSNQGKSNYLSMANRFFDYMHDCIPQICVDFPEYKLVNETFEIAVLIPDTNPDTIANAINNLLNDKQYYTRLQQNCLRAREVYNWQEQEKTLLQVYKTIFE